MWFLIVFYVTVATEGMTLTRYEQYDTREACVQRITEQSSRILNDLLNNSETAVPIAACVKVAAADER